MIDKSSVEELVTRIVIALKDQAFINCHTPNIILTNKTADTLEENGWIKVYKNERWLYINETYLGRIITTPDYVSKGTNKDPIAKKLENRWNKR